MKLWIFTTDLTECTEVKTESAYVCGGIRIHTLTQCIIFITFMSFMVKCICLFFVFFRAFRGKSVFCTMYLKA